ncbi:MAG TPA: SDR family NAD(P)-dependent oxidoreductase [Acidimicrobiales bacterium]|nr:SDR family NAD(P)-dependent oxidoreductase [Acidimicrobiales bacterium]
MSASREAEAVAGRFVGKTAIVTGAASGIGRATAARLAAEGAAVACLDVTGEGVEDTASGLRAAGATAKAYRCDVTDETEVGRAVDEVVSTLGPPNVLCNVAGIGWFAHAHEMPVADFERIVAVNLTGTFIMVRAVLPHLLELGGGAIVNVASTSGLVGAPFSAAYCASKGGVVLMTKSLAIEYADRRIRVNAVAPGGVDTPLIDHFATLPEGADPKHLRRMVSRMGMCTPDQVASAIAFLSSDESDYTTGAVLAVDGGITA